MHLLTIEHGFSFFPTKIWRVINFTRMPLKQNSGLRETRVEIKLLPILQKVLTANINCQLWYHLVPASCFSTAIERSTRPQYYWESGSEWATDKRIFVKEVKNQCNRSKSLRNRPNPWTHVAPTASSTLNEYLRFFEQICTNILDLNKVWTNWNRYFRFEQIWTSILDLNKFEHVFYIWTNLNKYFRFEQVFQFWSLCRNFSWCLIPSAIWAVEQWCLR